MSIDINKIKRNGTTIVLSKGLTATEGKNGNLPTLTIRNNGKITKKFKGSSLCFNKKLTDEDKRYLVSLAE